MAIMLNLAMVVTGLFAYSQLNVDSMPPINTAIITVLTNLEGASPSQVEVGITKRIEEALAVLSKLDYIRSASSVGCSQVSAVFLTGKDSNEALADVRQRVDALLNDFPQGTFPPIYGKFSLDDQPVLQLAVTGKRNLRDLTELTQYQISQPLQAINGVGQIGILGGQRRIVDISLSAEKLRRLAIPVSTVRQAIITQNAKIPGGYLSSEQNDFLVSQTNLIQTVQDFSQIVLSQSVDTAEDLQAETQEFQAQAIRLRHVANVKDGATDPNSLARLNGKTTLSLSITKTSEGNVLRVADEVKAMMAELKKTLPSDINIELVQDNSGPVQESVHELMQHLYLGSLLACLTVLIFIGSFRLTFISAIAIPVSLITSFAMMWLLNYTLNYMTLLALTLAVGIVVDDAVVVLENIYRIMEEQGLGPLEAASKGLEDIAFAVLATTLSLCVLFLPLAFMPGVIGEYFRSWGVTMAFSIMVSMIVSFTLTPVLCAKMLSTPKHAVEPSWLTRITQDLYVALLKICLKLRFLIIVLVVISLLWAVQLLQEVGKDFAGGQDESNYSVNLVFPNSWPLARVAEELRPIETDLQSLPHVEKVMSSIKDGDISNVSIFVGMSPYDKRKPYTQWNSMDDARALLSRYPLAKPSITKDGNPDFSYILAGDDLKQLEKLANSMVAELKKIEGFVDLDTNLVLSVPEIQVQIDPRRATALGVSPNEAATTLQILVGGAKITSFEEGGRDYDVRMRLAPDERRNPQDLNEIFVPGEKGQMVPLTSVATIKKALSPSTIRRYARKRMVEIRANLTPKLPLQAANDKADETLKKLKAPKGYGKINSGNAKLMQEAAVAALAAFVLAVLFMYMVLASQFESLIDPLIILCTIPLSLPFALFSLVATGMTLNLFSVLGLFLLFGVVKKNAILQIDRTNALIKEGQPVYEAILNANRDRLRPILMTTITLVVAMLPVAFAGPTGAERAPMAMVVVGGQTLCLLLTLVVVPVFTSYAHSFTNLGGRLWNWRSKKTAQEDSLSAPPPP